MDPLAQLIMILIFYYVRYVRMKEKKEGKHTQTQKQTIAHKQPYTIAKYFVEDSCYQRYHLLFLFLSLNNLFYLSLFLSTHFLLFQQY